MRALGWRLASLAVLAAIVALWAEIAALKLVPPMN